MSESVTTYHHPDSRAHMVHWMLEEIGEPYEIELVSFASGAHKTPAFLAKNPMGKLPTIEHRGIVVTETAAIIAYLADAFPAAGLAPSPSSVERGIWYRWLFFTAGCFEPATIDKAFQRPPVENTSSLGYGTYDATIDALEGALTPGPWILGDTFSAADVYVGGQIAFGLQIGSIPDRPAFVDYADRCTRRPAHGRVAAASAAFREQLAADGEG